MDTYGQIAHLNAYSHMRRVQEERRPALSHMDFGEVTSADSAWLTAGGQLLTGVANIVGAATGNVPTTVNVMPGTGGGYAPYQPQPGYIPPGAAGAGFRLDDQTLMLLGLGAAAIVAFMVLGKKSPTKAA